MASEALVKIKYAALVAPDHEHVACLDTFARMSWPLDDTATIRPVLLLRSTTGCMGEMGVPGTAPASMYTVHCGGRDVF
jgi:hypothetical protein